VENVLVLFRTHDDAFSQRRRRHRVIHFKHGAYDAAIAEYTAALAKQPASPRRSTNAAKPN